MKSKTKTILIFAAIHAAVFLIALLDGGAVQSAADDEEEGTLIGAYVSEQDLELDNIEVTATGRLQWREGRLYAEFGEVSKGFKVKNTGYSSSINDVAAFVFEAERDGANMDELWKYVKISPKDAAKWLGLSEERFEAEYGDYVEKKKKADTLVREY